MLLHIQLLLLLHGIHLLLDKASFEPATLTCQRNSACKAQTTTHSDVNSAQFSIHVYGV
jgi:hypothetical protein